MRGASQGAPVMVRLVTRVNPLPPRAGAGRDWWHLHAGPVDDVEARLDAVADLVEA